MAVHLHAMVDSGLVNVGSGSSLFTCTLGDGDEEMRCEYKSRYGTVEWIEERGVGVLRERCLYLRSRRNEFVLKSVVGRTEG